MLKQTGGVSPLVIVAVIVVAALGAGGYFMSGKFGSPLSSVTGLALNPNCKYNDPDLCKFINNWKDIKNYSVKSTVTSKSSGSSESLFELSGEDKFHMALSEKGKEVYNVITIADTTYTKDYSDNKWWKQKQEKQAESAKENYEIKFDEGEAEDKTTYKSQGKESCGSGLSCFKYQVINPDFADTTEYIWFDDKEYLLRRTRTETKDGDVTDSTVSYDKVNISEPSPTKEAKDGQVVIPGAGAVPGLSESDKKELEKATQEAQEELKNLNIQVPSGDDSEN